MILRRQSHPVHAFARTLERAHRAALLADAGRKEPTNAVRLPTGGLLDFAQRCSFWPAQQPVHLRCFGALPETRFLLTCFVLAPEAYFGMLESAPNACECNLSARELPYRCHAGQTVPDLNEPLQRPSRRERFPLVPTRERLRSVCCPFMLR